MAPQGTLTYADLEAFPDDGKRREIIDGELFVSPSPSLRHQAILGRLHLVFGNHIAAHGGGEAYFAPLDVVLSDSNVVEPDLLVVSTDNLPILTAKNVQGAPDLVIEILSQNASYDRVRKRDLYARWGVPTYWIVDPESDRIEVLALDGDRYARPVVLEAGDALTVAFLPGLQIDVGQILAR